MNPIINKAINGYTIKHHIGSGGMADVYYAENRLRKPAAIKVLKKKFSDEPNIHKRFSQEAEIMVSLDHPHIRKVYDIGDIDGNPAIIMEYLSGQTLREKINKVPSEQLKKYFEQCVSALTYTHTKDIIHRDIKPSNIFITEDNEVKIIDFGIAKIKEGIVGTDTGQSLGTILYMSPEQIESSKNVTTKTDLYSLAVTFHHVLSGKIPYGVEESDTAVNIMYKIATIGIDTSSLSREWKKVLDNCLIKKPKENRKIVTFNTANYSEETEVIQPIPKPQPTPTPSSKLSIPSWIWFAIGGLILMLLVGKLYIKNSKKSSPSPPEPIVNVNPKEEETPKPIKEPTIATKKELQKVLNQIFSKNNSQKERLAAYKKVAPQINTLIDNKTIFQFNGLQAKDMQQIITNCIIKDARPIIKELKLKNNKASYLEIAN